MFRVSIKVVLCISGTSDRSGDNQHMMLLYFWPVHLSVVNWITLILFSGVLLSSVYEITMYSQINHNSVVRIVTNMSRYSSITPVLKRLH